MAHTLPQGIEIFKPGRHTDDSGTVHSFSAADVAGMAACYNPAKREAPLCIGHPKDNLPAYGLVQSLAVNTDGNLAMNTHAVEPQFAEIVHAKRYAKRSASFYPPGHPSNPQPGNWYLRHVAFLGAQQPAIAGLKDIAFYAADATGTVNFSFDDAAGTVNFSEPLFNQEQLRMSQELKDQLAASQAQAAAADAARTKAEGEATEARTKLAEFAEAARTQRTAGFVSFADAQIKTGALLPKEKDAAVAVLDTLADAKSVSFSEAGAVRTVSAVDWLKDLITRAKPAVSFGEFAAGTPPGAGQGAAGLTDAELDAKAQAYARQHKCNYAEALSAVVSFTA